MIQLLERYRSGHNEAVLKTVCPRGHVGSNPTGSAKFDEVTPVSWTVMLQFTGVLLCLYQEKRNWQS